MTSDELAFTQALDAEPGDHTVRLVFADWLDDRDDPRAAGYRALGRLERLPHCDYGAWSYHNGEGICVPPGVRVLPEHSLEQVWLDQMDCQTHYWSADMPTRAAAEDAAAIAWTKLTPSQQARILADAGVMA